MVLDLQIKSLEYTSPPTKGNLSKEILLILKGAEMDRKIEVYQASKQMQKTLKALKKALMSKKEILTVERVETLLGEIQTIRKKIYYVIDKLNYAYNPSTIEKLANQNVYALEQITQLRMKIIKE